MRTLIIPDIHHHTKRADGIIAAHPADQIVFLGDYFDSYGDSPADAERTAVWLRDSLEKPNRIHLLGNHDMPYAFSENAHLYCPGWTPEKSEVVNQIISREQWEKMKLVHIMGRLVCSHAGISRHVFEHPIRGMTAQSIGKTCSEALSAARAGLFHHATAWSPFPDDGRGGLTWLRWWEMPIIPEFCQVVGHTPGELRYEFENDSFKVCLDTYGEWAGLVEHDTFHVVSTGTLPTVTLGSIAI